MNQSRDQLSKSLDRRVRHLMIRTLERFEDSFEDLENTRDGQIFKGDIKNSFNDVMRAQRDELRDYEIEYRPLKLNTDNTLATTRTFIETVQKVDFGFHDDIPFVAFHASNEHGKVLDAIRSELTVGVIFINDDKNLILEIAGVEDCINRVLPIMDRYRFHPEVRIKYKEWRGELVKQYTGDRYDD